MRITRIFEFWISGFAREGTTRTSGMHSLLFEAVRLIVSGERWDRLCELKFRSMRDVPGRAKGVRQDIWPSRI